MLSHRHRIIRRAGFALALFSATVGAQRRAPHTPPSTQTAEAVRAIKTKIKDFRVEIACFDHDKRDEQRTIDVQVTDLDETAARSAEGLMTPRQAERVLEALVIDGYFDRAQPFGAAQWNPPPQPFYVVQVRTGDGESLLETRPVDAKLLGLLIHVRRGLGNTAAARAADRAVAAIDPQQQQFKPATQPVARPSVPELPEGASKLHPGYTFRPIDAAWEVEESFLKPAHGEFVSRASRVDPADDFTGYFRQLEYRDAKKNNRVAKIVTLYPSGKVYEEHDSYMYGVDLPQGEAYDRTFAENGSIVAYAHGKDGGTVDGWSRAPDGSIDRVADGHGVMHRLTFDPKCYEVAWYYQGLVLLSRKFVDGTCVDSSLTDNTEWGKAAGLDIGRDGSEMLLQDGYMWDKAPDGSVKRKTLYRNEDPAPAVDVAKSYGTARQHFNRRFVARAKAAGFKPDEMGIAALVADIGNEPHDAGPTTAPSR